MRRRMSVGMFGLLFLVGSACGSSTSGASGTPTPASPSQQPSASAVPVSYDPCVLMNQQEASALTGVNFGPGREDLANATKECIYGYQTTDVLTIGIVQAPDLATAQAAEAEAKAALQKAAANGLSFTDIQGIGDAAVEVQASKSFNGTTLNVCGIYVLKGTIFFFIADVAANRAVPGSAALQTQASTVLGRL